MHGIKSSLYQAYNALPFKEKLVYIDLYVC